MELVTEFFSPRRIGLFGGSFDPPHLGHVAFAEAAKQALALDEVWLIPAGNPWQKKPLIASPEQRLEMLHLAFHGLDHYFCLTTELERQSRSYTIDTLKEIRQRFGRAQTTLVLLIGSDQWHNLTTWHCWQELFDYAHIAYAVRAGVISKTLDPLLQKEYNLRFSTDLLSGFSSDFSLCDTPNFLSHPFNGLFGSITEFVMPAVDCSSSMIRQKLHADENCQQFLNLQVLDYIKSQHIYT